MAADTRKRTYEFIMYKDSMPDNAIDILKDLHIPMYISPLHTKEDNDKEIKEHYHVMIMFDGKKPASVVYEIADMVNGHVDKITNGVVSSPVAYARYLCHLDEDNKKQYDVNDVLEIGAVKYAYTDYILLPKDEFRAIMEICDFIVDTPEIRCLYQLVNYCLFNKKINWFKIIKKNTYFFDRYLYNKNIFTKYENSSYYDYTEGQDYENN